MFHSQSPKSGKSLLRVSIDALLLRLPPSPSSARIVSSSSCSTKTKKGKGKNSAESLGSVSVQNSSASRPSAVLTSHNPPAVCGLFTIEEARLLARTLKKCLERCDFGAEVVIRLLNDKRSLFKSLLAKCTEEAHDIQVFDVSTLRKQCPRAVSVSDGVTLFFKRVAKVLELGQNKSEDELREMARANGMMHYRMKVWFQAENWLCVKKSVVDTILMTNTKHSTTANLSECSSRFRSCSVDFLDSKRRKERQAIENVWSKIMSFVIHHMKQGFLEAAMNGNEEDVKL